MDAHCRNFTTFLIWKTNSILYERLIRIKRTIGEDLWRNVLLQNGINKNLFDILELYIVCNCIAKMILLWVQEECILNVQKSGESRIGPTEILFSCLSNFVFNRCKVHNRICVCKTHCARHDEWQRKNVCNNEMFCCFFVCQPYYCLNSLLVFSNSIITQLNC